MEKEVKRGGKRNGSGRKPANNPKKPITVYIETDKISASGGEGELKSKITEFVTKLTLIPLLDIDEVKKMIDELGGNRSQDEIERELGSGSFFKYKPSKAKAKLIKAPKAGKTVAVTIPAKNHCITNLTQPTNTVEPEKPMGSEKSNFVVDTWGGNASILAQIKAVEAEKIPEHRNTSIGRKAWQLEKNNRIIELQKQLK